MELDPKKRLKGLKVTFVSLVDKGANRRTFMIAKSQDDGFDFQKEVDIIAKNEEERIVFGSVYAPNEPDTDGEWATEEDIRKASYDFMENFTNIDVQHSFVPGAGSPIESWVFKKDDEVYGHKVKKGEWVLGVRVKDEKAWSGIKSGQLNSFSLAGVVQKEDKSTDKNLLEKIFDGVSKLLKQNNDEEFDMNEKEIQEMIDKSFDTIKDKLDTLVDEVKTLKEQKQEVQIDDAEIIKSHSGAIKELQEAFDALAEALIVKTKSNPSDDGDDEDPEKKTKSEKPRGKWNFK